MTRPPVSAALLRGLLERQPRERQLMLVRDGAAEHWNEVPDHAATPKDLAGVLGRWMEERQCQGTVDAVVELLCEEPGATGAAARAIASLAAIDAFSHPDELAAAWEAPSSATHTGLRWSDVAVIQGRRIFALAQAGAPLDDFVARVASKMEDRGVYADPLDALRARVRSRCRLPRRFDPDPGSVLDEVTVELIVDRGTIEQPCAFAAHSDTKACRDIANARGGRPFPFRKLLDPDEPQRHWVVLGVPGSGKSTALRRLALLDSIPQPCVLLRMTELMGGGIEAAVERLAKGAWEPVKTAWQHHGGCLLIDGLDEAGRTNVDATERVDALASRFDKLHIVLTSRPVDFHKEVHPGFQRVRLLALDEAQQKNLLANWLRRQPPLFGPDFTKAAGKELERFGRHPRLRELCATPLILALIGIVRTEGQALPSGRGVLYTEVLRVLLQGAHRDGGEEGSHAPEVVPEAALVEASAQREAGWLERLPLVGALLRWWRGADEASPPPSVDLHRPPTAIGVGAALEVLADVALHAMLDDSLVDEARDTLGWWAFESTGQQHAHQPGWQAWRGRLEDLFDQCIDAGLLERAPDAGPDRWAFAHRTLLEVLVARALVRDRSRGEGRWFGQALRAAEANPARWAEVFALMPGLDVDAQTVDSDALVAQIQETGNSALLHQVLVDADDLSEETVWRVLDFSGGRDGWEERAVRWEQLPQLVGHNPGLVLGLAERYLDGMAVGTRPHHGVDLWFIGWLCDQVATADVWGPEGDRPASEDLRKRARVVKDKRFAHISKEQGAAAVACLTRLGARLFPDEADPLAAIWRTIPEGVGWMGSPEGEGRSSERPQLRVAMGPGLLMLAVPVTLDLYACMDPAHEGERSEFRGKVVRGADGELPTYRVSWWEASVFAEWVSTLRAEWGGCRLPLEEEWEYACRAWLEETPPPPWHSGATVADLDKVAWTDRNAEGRPHPVGNREKNTFDLFDLHGNVDEWCASEWMSDHSGRGGRGADSGHLQHAPSARVPPPAEPTAGRVLRGGSWFRSPVDARAAYRLEGPPSGRSVDLGFRLVLAPEHRR